MKKIEDFENFNMLCASCIFYVGNTTGFGYCKKHETAVEINNLCEKWQR